MNSSAPGSPHSLCASHSEMGRPLAKVAALLRTRLGVQVTAGGRVPSAASKRKRRHVGLQGTLPAWSLNALGGAEQRDRHMARRNAVQPVLVVDVRHRRRPPSRHKGPGRAFDDAVTVLGQHELHDRRARTRWARQVYAARYKRLHHSCINHLLQRRTELHGETSANSLWEQIQGQKALVQSVLRRARPLAGTAI